MEWTTYHRWLEGQFDGSNVVDFDSDTLRIMIATARYTPDRAADAFVADVRADEVRGTNYAPGGPTLTNVAVAVAGERTSITAERISIGQSGGGFGDGRTMVLYKDTGDPATSPLIAFRRPGADFGNVAGPLSLDVTVDLIITPGRQRRPDHRPPGRQPGERDAYATAVTGIEGLVAYWRFDDAHGLADASGHGHGGTFASPPPVPVPGLSAPWQAGDDRALDFRGKSHGVVGHDPAFALARGTLGFYFKASEAAIAGEHGLLGKDRAGSGAPDDQMALRLFSDGRLRCYWQRGGRSVDLDTQSGVIRAGQAYHVIVAWDEVAVWLLLDGRVVAWKRRHTTGLTGNDLPWRFGIRTFDDAPADVVLDEVALYDRRLSWAELDVLSEHVRGLAYPATATTSETIRSGDAAALERALASGHGAGHHIILEPGTYADVSATVPANGGGSKWNPVVVRARDGPGTVQLIDPDIKLRCEWIVFDGIDVKSGHISPDSSACRYWRITRCTWTGIDEHASVVRGLFGRGDHCDLSDIRSAPETRAAGFRLDINGDDPAGFPKRACCYNLFDHNHLHDTAPTEQNGHELIQLGANQDDSSLWPYCTIQHNRFSRTLADGEIISIKSNGHVFIGNTYTDFGGSAGQVTGCRHGGEIWFEGEWAESIGKSGAKNSGYRVLNRDCVVLGMRIRNCDFKLFGGDGDADDWMDTGPGTGGATYPAAKRALLIGIQTEAGGTIQIGWNRGDHGIKASDTEIYECSPVTRGPLDHNSQSRDGPSPIPWKAAVPLSAGEVGPRAADPLVPPGWK